MKPCRTKAAPLDCVLPDSLRDAPHDCVLPDSLRDAMVHYCCPNLCNICECELLTTLYALVHRFMHGPDIRKIVTAIASAMAAYVWFRLLSKPSLPPPNRIGMRPRVAT